MIIIKRDLDLIRDILFKIEEISPKRTYCDDFINSENNFEKVSYHLELLNDANFIICSKIAIMCSLSYDFTVYRLTSSGHDYLDSVRDPVIYNKTKKKLGTFAKGIALPIVQSVSESFIKAQLGI